MCGAQLVGKQVKYCSRTCKKRAHDSRRVRSYDAKKRQEKYRRTGFGRSLCEVCGVEYVKTYRGQRTCGRTCGKFLAWTNAGKPLSMPRLHGQHSDLIVCPDCGRRVEKTPRRVFCPHCAHDRARAGVWRQGVKLCSDCGVPIPVYKGSGNVCKECAERLHREREREYRRRTGMGNHRKRARVYGVEYEPLSKRKVFERDGYRCHICGRKTNPRARVNTRRYPTIDHLIPMSLGGGHTYENVACACFECNSLKSAGCTGEQLILVGHC